MYRTKALFVAGLFLLSFLTPTITLGGTTEKIIFLHHSTGSGVYNGGGVRAWFDNYNQTHGTSYAISDRSYPSSPYPWANYAYDYWNLWVNGMCDSSRPGIECMDTLARDHDVIIFKHCYPGSAVREDTGSPDITSSRRSLENYKLQYRALRTLMDSHPDTKFIVWTLAPLHRNASDPATAARAARFVDWVKTDFLTEDGRKHPNIFLFDFWGNVAETDPNPLRGETNHLRYDYERNHDNGDSHPNTLANQTVGPVFAQRIVDVINTQETVSLEGVYMLLLE